MSGKDNYEPVSDKEQNGSADDGSESKYVYFQILKGNIVDRGGKMSSSRDLGHSGNSKFIPIEPKVNERSAVDPGNKTTFKLTKSSSSSGKMISVPLNPHSSVFKNKIMITPNTTRSGGTTSASSVTPQFSPATTKSIKLSLSDAKVGLKTTSPKSRPNFIVCQGSNAKKSFTSVPKILSRKNFSKSIPVTISNNELTSTSKLTYKNVVFSNSQGRRFDGSSSSSSSEAKTNTKSPSVFNLLTLNNSTEERRGVNIYSLAKGEKSEQADRVNFKISNGQIQSEKKKDSLPSKSSKKSLIPTIDLVEDEEGESKESEVLASKSRDSSLNVPANRDALNPNVAPTTSSDSIGVSEVDDCSSNGKGRPDDCPRSSNVVSLTMGNVLSRLIARKSPSVQMKSSTTTENTNKDLKLLGAESTSKDSKLFGAETQQSNAKLQLKSIPSLHKDSLEDVDHSKTIVRQKNSAKEVQGISISTSSSISLGSTKEVDNNSLEQGRSGLKNLLQWSNGTGELVGSDLKFRCNEYDAVELIEDEGLIGVKDLIMSSSSSAEAAEDVPSCGGVSRTVSQSTPGSCLPRLVSFRDECSDQEITVSETLECSKNQEIIAGDNGPQSSILGSPSRSSQPPHSESVGVRTPRSRKANLSSLKLEEKNPDGHQASSSRRIGDGGKSQDQYDICCCKNCGCYGLISEFSRERDNDFCTTACSEDYRLKEVSWTQEKSRLMKNKNKNKRSKQTEKMLKHSEQKDQSKDGIQMEISNRLHHASTPTTIWRDPTCNKVFSWDTYIDHCVKLTPRSRLAPLKLWDNNNPPLPSRPNRFKAGMKLEGIDVRDQSHFCVITVAEVIGYRIRLHFDGYSDIFDFWCNADSPFIFPAGWCESNGKKLETPPGIFNFSWNAYLHHCKAISAPEEAFAAAIKETSSSVPSHIRIGMKLEAENRTVGLYCVATLSDVIGNRFLIHYDGWGKCYDTWLDMNSPYLHPVGWCNKNNVKLQPPSDYSKSENFNWHEYLQETNSMAIPARAFKTNPTVMAFEPEMKVEMVDRRNPIVVRVATIAEVKENKLLVHFDGWPDLYDYWVDISSPDVHPPTWCSKTGHPLQPPLTPEQNAEDVDSGIGCGTPGCKGTGHFKGPIYSTHHTAFGCPYSLQNLHKFWEDLLPDRLATRKPDASNSKDTLSKCANVVNLDASKPLPHELGDDQDTQKKRVRKRRRFFDEISSSENSSSKSKIPRTQSEEYAKERYSSSSFPRSYDGGAGGIGQNTFSNEHEYPQDSHPSIISSQPSFSSEKDVAEGPCSVTTEKPNIDTVVHQSVFNPGYCPKPLPPVVPSPSFALEQHRHIIDSLSVCHEEAPHCWTSLQVKDAVSKLPGVESCAETFLNEDIDGESLLMLTQNDIIDILGLKLGPAVKIMSLILALRSK